MPRVKGGTIHAARRKKTLNEAKGYFGSKHRLYRTAKEQVMHSLHYAYRDRRQKKRDFRKLWITRINAGCRINNISYSKFINGLAKANVEVNRKMLADLAITNPEGFAKLVSTAKDALDGKMPEVAKVVKKAEAKKVVKEEVSEDLSKLTVAELKERASKANIEGYTSMKKAELVDALSK